VQPVSKCGSSFRDKSSLAYSGLERWRTPSAAGEVCCRQVRLPSGACCGILDPCDSRQTRLRD
ncbi:unnamed protein product, partial [Durusdinium trenchii]